MHAPAAMLGERERRRRCMTLVCEVDKATYAQGEKMTKPRLSNKCVHAHTHETRAHLLGKPRLRMDSRSRVLTRMHAANNK